MIRLSDSVARLFFRHSPPPGANDEKTGLVGPDTQGCGCCAAFPWATIFRHYVALKWIKNLLYKAVWSFSLG
jgi:hypothetical protein